MKSMSNFDDFLKTSEGNVAEYIGSKYAGKPPLQDFDLSEKEREWGREAVSEFYEALLKNANQGKCDFAEVVCDIAAKEMDNPDVIIGDKTAIDFFAKKIALYSMLAVNTACDNALNDKVPFSMAMGLENASTDEYMSPDGCNFIEAVKAGEYSYAAGVYDFVSNFAADINYDDEEMKNDLLNDIRLLAKTAINMVTREKEILKIRETTRFYKKQNEEEKVLA